MGMLSTNAGKLLYRAVNKGTCPSGGTTLASVYEESSTAPNAASSPSHKSYQTGLTSHSQVEGVSMCITALPSTSVKDCHEVPGTPMHGQALFVSTSWSADTSGQHDLSFQGSVKLGHLCE